MAIVKVCTESNVFLVGYNVNNAQRAILYFST